VISVLATLTITAVKAFDCEETRSFVVTMFFSVIAEVMACVYLDNKLVKQTDWKPVSQQCWDLRFILDLDRVRRLGCFLCTNFSVLTGFSDYKLLLSVSVVLCPEVVRNYCTSCGAV